MRLVVGISGVTGAIFGSRLLQMLRSAGVKTNLIISDWAKVTIQQETEFTVPVVETIASETHSSRNLAAAISGGSVKTDGMIIAPCSMKNCGSDTWWVGERPAQSRGGRGPEERRKLVLLPRTSPFNEIHLGNMLTLSHMGVVMVRPVLAFYNNPKSLDDVINHIVVRTLDPFGIDSPNASVLEW